MGIGARLLRRIKDEIGSAIAAPLEDVARGADESRGRTLMRAEKGPMGVGREPFKRLHATGGSVTSDRTEVRQ